MSKFFPNKNFKIKRTRKLGREIELQEVFFDQLSQQKEKELGREQKRIEIPLSRKILRGFFIFSLVLILALFLKTFQFQVIEGKNFSSLAQKNKVTSSLIRPIRGVIYDRNMNQLVSNRPSPDLMVDLRDLPLDKNQQLQLFEEIGGVIGQDPQLLKEKIEKSDLAQLPIVQNLDHQILILLKVKIKNQNDGFFISDNLVREYKDDRAFSHLMGYTGRINREEFRKLEDYSISDYIGREGLEKYYEKELKGTPGVLETERDAFSNLISEKVISEPQPGESLVLWLDTEFQEKANQILEKNLKKFGGKKGVVVALDPNTGGVLSLVSLPNFDNNEFAQGLSPSKLAQIKNDSSSPLFNRVIAGRYPTGSTIKPLIASAALEEKVVSPLKKIYCEGLLSIPNPWHPQSPSIYRDWKAHGWTDLRKAIAESCDVYFYILGGGYEDFQGLGVERIKKYLGFFGWEEPTNIDLPGERGGIVPDPQWKESHFKNDNIWRVGDTYNLSIGQGDLAVTPLEVASAFAAIANGGILYSPKVVHKIIGSSTSSREAVKEIKPEVLNKDFISPENLRIVKEGMRQAVTEGTATCLINLPVRAAAKTGTAETSVKDRFNQWMVAFAPDQDSQIVLLVMAEKSEYRAGLNIIRNTNREILDWYFSSDRFPQD